MNSVKKNFAYQSIFRILTIITPLITAPILSRALGVEKLGIFTATGATVGYFTLFSMLGIENYGSRSIAATRNEKKSLQTVFWNVYTIQIVASLLSIAAYTIVVVFLVDESRKMVALYQGILILASLLNINWFFWGTEQFKIITIRNILIKILTVALIVIFVKSPDDLSVYTIIMSGDSLLSSIIMWPFLKKNIGFLRPRLNEIKKHFKPVMVLFVPVLAMSVYHIMDKTMLDYLSTENEVGYYYSADKIISLPLGLITALSVVVLPRVANIYQNGDSKHINQLLEKTTELNVFLTSAIGIGIAAIAKEFVPFFYGVGYEPCVLLVYWFIPVIFAKSIGDLIRVQYMIPTKKDNLYVTSVFVGMGVNLISNYFLIKHFAALGAVIGTLIAETTVTAMNIFLTRKEVSFTRYIVKQFMYPLFSIVMLFVVRVVSSINGISIVTHLVLMIISGACTYIALCLIYWSFNNNSIFHKYSLTALINRFISRN